MQSPHVFWRLQTSKSNTVIMERNKHGILRVSISVAWFQKCVHIKSCLARGHVPKAWRVVKMTFVSAPMKAKYTQSKANCPIFLLSFMQKMMQKLVTRNIKDETLGHVPTSVTISSNHGSPQKPQYTMWITHIQKEVKNGKSILSFPRNNGASDNTSFWNNKDFQRAWAWRHTPATDWLQPNGRKITATLTGESLEGSVAKCWLQMAILLPIAMKPLCVTHCGTQELLSYTEVCVILICGKFTISVYKILEAALRIEQRCGKTQIPIYPQKLQHLDQYVMKPGHLDEIC